ncbi:MAG: phosphomannomutase/phosphoglucomutase [Alphaproteobacteria bacterium]|nr:MAG: phosphomannomutase/phosphoglucomutase [Alphaproteobacteria bacterium]
MTAGTRVSGHAFHPTILREYDVRGIVGETLGVEDARALGRAYAAYLARAGQPERLPVAVGRDGRLSSPELAEALIAGITAGGRDVIDIGLGPTPMLYFAVHHLGLAGGIMVTGSHNPPDYNGFKMMAGTQPLFGEAIAELGRIAASGPGPSEHKGRVLHQDLLDRYVSRLVCDVRTPALSIVWDSGNGAAGPAVQALTRHLPGDHELLFEEVDGRFPNHHPDPTVESNLADLKQAVRARGADLGIAFDGDGDRIGAVDGRGRVVWGDQILLILARALLAELPGVPIIADVKASQHLFDGIAAAGGEPVMWKTGHSLIKTKMAETGAPLAGEMSGHIFFRHRYYGFDDALYAAVRLLEAIGRSGRTLAELLDDLPKSAATPEIRIDCPEEEKRKVVARLARHLAEEGRDVVDVDGVRVVMKEGWWLVRASNTQPVLVARIEGRDEAALERLESDLRAALASVGFNAKW